MNPSRISLCVATTCIIAACSTNPSRVQQDEQPAEPVEPDTAVANVKLLAFNDMHGHITGPSGSVKVQGAKVDAGGADHMAARVQQIRAAHPNTLVVTAGDMIGASPLISSLFHDEPTIEALNAMGVDAASVGNHEFDEGVDELKRLMTGGCHPTDGCQDGDDFAGANFPMLAANVIVESTQKTLFDAVIIKEVDGVKVGFIGLTLEGTPAIVEADGVKGLSFQDEADTINAHVPKLQEQGVQTIVVLIHEGGAPQAALNDVSDCPGISGPIVDIVGRTDSAVDVFVTGHTHQAYICEINGKLVTAAKSFARLLTEIDLQIDRATGDVIGRSAKNLVIDRVGTPHPDVDAIVKKYDAIAAPLAKQKVGDIQDDISRDPNEDGESTLGRLIADVQLQATQGPNKGNAQIAFMNPGGIRGSLTHAPSSDEGPGVVTYEEVHTVQPFGNSLVTLTLTGQQLHDMLEAQWTNQERVRLLQVSQGFSYEWSESAPVGDKVDPAKITYRGQPIRLDAEYRVTVNSFLAAGGDGFTMLETGTNRVGGPIDLQALVAWFRDRAPIAPPSDQRVRRVK